MRKIALVGTALSGASAPFNDDSWEIWGVSQRAEYVTRATRWFELHRLDGEPSEWAKLWRKTLKNFIGDTPLYMIYPELDLANNIVQYPVDKIVDRFGTFFMTSTFSWMMAMAIDEMCPDGPKPNSGHIAIYGVDMEYGTEYRQQRSGFRHFIELAKHFGITVTRLADGGLVYEPVPYPMWQDDPLLSKLALRNKIATDRLESFKASLQNIHMMMAQNNSIIDMLSEIKAKGLEFDIDDKLVKVKKELKNLTSSAVTIDKDILKLQGSEEEQRWMIDYLQP